jgi:hypothetical protein
MDRFELIKETRNKLKSLGKHYTGSDIFAEIKDLILKPLPDSYVQAQKKAYDCASSADCNMNLLSFDSCEIHSSKPAFCSICEELQQEYELELLADCCQIIKEDNAELNSIKSRNAARVLSVNG